MRIACVICRLFHFAEVISTICVHPSTVPSPPRKLIGGNTDITSVVVQWLPPLNPNGIINAYTVYYSRGPSFNQSTASSLVFNSNVTTQPVKGLKSNTQYTFTVVASNTANMSAFSSTVTIFVPSECTTAHTYMYGRCQKESFYTNTHRYTQV